MVDSGSWFVLNSETTIHGTISRFHNVLANFGFPSYFFRAVTMQCITQAGTNLKAGQSCGPEKVCLQPSVCSGVSRDA